MTTTRTTAATVSAALRKAGFNPVSPSNSREGLKVREVHSGVRVTADLDSPAASHLLAGDALQVLSALGYEVEEIPVRTEIAAFRVTGRTV